MNDSNEKNTKTIAEYTEEPFINYRQYLKDKVNSKKQIKLKPMMLQYLDSDQQTLIHQAVLNNDLELIKLMFQVDSSWYAKVNGKEESVCHQSFLMSETAAEVNESTAKLLFDELERANKDTLMMSNITE